ncbi:linker histone H1 and H5 family protein [Teladorsagia circumcincta]|uniref:Linker histone H1 and H5 family protein n=1 Tax=Teladorsagia circumcincta TaxID=45464 RepID=A0A2G9UJJ9_TELCI|nr:linker histone H1 and H5 family protein [Teladorsagia circumcincta]
MRGAPASFKDKKTSKAEEPDIIVLEDDETKPKGEKTKPKGANTKPKDAKITKLKDAKNTKAKAETKRMPPHPTYAAMIKKSIIELKERSGSSKAAILKYILAHYNLGDNATKVNNQLRLALKRAVIKGELKQVKGVGASGSFRLEEKKAAAPKTTRKPAARKGAAKKPATAKSPKEPKTPKAAAAKKPKAEKKAKTPKKAKAPKMKTAQKPAATKKVAKPKTPQKTKASKPKRAK